MAFDFENKVNSVANNYGIPPGLLRSVAIQESGGKQYDESGQVILGQPTKYGQAVGMMQLLPSTAAELHVDPFDPDQNLIGGAKYLSQLNQMFGDWGSALQAYNGGLRNVQNGTVSPDAKTYSKQVLERAGMGGAVDSMPSYDEMGNITGYTNSQTATYQKTQDELKNNETGLKDKSFFGISLPNAGLFVIGVAILGIGLAVSVFGAPDKVIKTLVKNIPAA